MSGLNGAAGSPDGGACQAMPMSCDTAMVPPSAHMAVDRSDTSTTWASPVRSRCRSAAEMPPAMVMAPIESPNAGPGWLSGWGRSEGVTEWATPERAQNPSES